MSRWEMAVSTFLINEKNSIFIVIIIRVNESN